MNNEGLNNTLSDKLSSKNLDFFAVDMNAPPEKSVTDQGSKNNSVSYQKPKSGIHKLESDYVLEVKGTGIISRNDSLKDDAPVNFIVSSKDSSLAHEKLNDSIYKEQAEFYNENKKPEDDKNEEDYVIKLRNLHKTYLIGLEGVPALRGVSLNIKRGEFVIILGTSGGGKTSLLNIIGTIDNPSRGDIKIFSEMVRHNTEDAYLSQIRLEKLAFVFQSFNLLPNLNVVENVELPMKIKGNLSGKEMSARSTRLIQDVGLSNRMNHFPNQLSGGEQQRVTIARALANEPEILLLDEPTGDLDTKNSDIVMDMLVRLNEEKGITMIMVTHDVGLKYFGNRVVRMVDGKINKIEEINENERNEHKQKLRTRILNKEHLGLREGISSEVVEQIENNSNNPQSKTFVRKVTDYRIKNLNR